jgi:hypothetical protein
MKFSRRRGIAFGIPENRVIEIFGLPGSCGSILLRTGMCVVCGREEPLIHDLKLAEALGMPSHGLRDIRRLIKNNMKEIQLHGRALTKSALVDRPGQLNTSNRGRGIVGSLRQGPNK